MFGYVRPDAMALRVREYTCYRGVYCGLCRAMGQTTGQLSRLTLSYDFTFLALVRSILTEPFRFVPHRCAAHPTHTRLMAEPHPALTYTAAAAAYLTEAKRQDDWVDERGLHRVPSALLLPLTRPMQHKATKALPETETLIAVCERQLGLLSEKERGGCGSPDEMAQVFGELLGEIFALGLPEPACRIAHAIGTGTGRYLYLCDAMDDLSGDVAAGRYNPLSVLWGELALDEDGKPTAMVRDGFVTAAGLDLAGLGRAVELLPGGPMTEIVKNIVYLGMPDMVRRIADGKSINGKSIKGKTIKGISHRGELLPQGQELADETTDRSQTGI